jgi:flavin-dependent dehydrogenase
VGDAAGLVEPITGEGISFAMQSGKFAAEAVLSAQSAGSPEMAYRLYKQKYAYLKKTLFKVKLFRYFFYPRIFLLPSTKLFASSKSVIKKQQDLIAGEIAYNDYFIFVFKYFWKQVFKNFAK